MAEPAQANPPYVAAYMPALDGVRALSILLVILAHLGLSRVLPGAFGVTLFFFISGYLITRQLLANLASHGQIGLGGFYLRRALRLMPASLAYIMVAGLLYEAAGGRIGPAGWVSAFAYGANYYDVWGGYVSTVPGVRHPFNILWSLAVEEHFYLLWPLALGLVWRRRGLFWGILGFCLLVLAWRWVLFDACFPDGDGLLCAPPPENPVWRGNQLYLGTDTRADSIGWGALLAIAEARAPGIIRSISASVPLLLLALATLLAVFATHGDFVRFVIRPTLQGASLLVLIPAAIHRDSVVRRALCRRPAVTVGRLSYSLYLWHWAALGVADWAAWDHPTAWLAIAAPLTVILAAVSYFGIEQPMLHLRRRAGSHAPLALTGS